MKLFQNGNPYRNYFKYFHANVKKNKTFSGIISDFLSDRFCSSHILEPIYKNADESFYTNAGDAITQMVWAKEMGLPKRTKLTDILKFQIEESKCDIFYNLDPLTYNNNFIKNLPSNVKRKIAWCGILCDYYHFDMYDSVVCNFPSLLERMKANGLKSNYFSPSYDVEIEKLNTKKEREIDLIFTGSITRNHTNRLKIIFDILPICADYSISINLDVSNFIKIANLPLIKKLFPKKYHFTDVLDDKINAPLYGLELYRQISNSKIVLNCSIDMYGNSRGNIRCFEALNCGALLYTDEGIYPQEFKPGIHFLDYKEISEKQIRHLLINFKNLEQISIAGNSMLKEKFSKRNQWINFMGLI